MVFINLDLLNIRIIISDNFNDHHLLHTCLMCSIHKFHMRHSQPSRYHFLTRKLIYITSIKPIASHTHSRTHSYASVFPVFPVRHASASASTHTLFPPQHTFVTCLPGSKPCTVVSSHYFFSFHAN